MYPLNYSSLIYDLVNEAILFGFLSRHKIISLAIRPEDFYALAAVVGKYGSEPIFDLKYMLSVYLNICSLALETAEGLVDHYLGIWERKTLPLCSGAEQK